MNENTKENIGCFIILVFIAAAAIFFMWRSNRAADIGMEKMDYCIEHKLTSDQCRQQWNNIEVKERD